jgi:hypothetical protein
MKNSIKILIAVLILIILGGSFYIYKIKQGNNAEPFVPIVSNSTENKTLTDEQFIKISEDPEAKVLARGDINKDGFEDAIVAETFCGASCSVNLAVVLNQDNKKTKLVEEGRFEGYTAGTALQSDVQEITIVDGTISITGRGLDCGYTCTEENWDIIKTLKYELIDNNIVRLPVN